MRLEPLDRLTDLRLKALLRAQRSEEEPVPDGTVPGLLIRISPGGTASWSLLFRVSGEGGTNKHGKPLLGPKRRMALGAYPEVSLQAARAKANGVLDQAKRGINSKVALEQSATAGSLTVEEFSSIFMAQYVRSAELDSEWKYRAAFNTHINPKIGKVLVELLSREQAREVMDGARVKRKRPKGQRGGQIGGIEAARTVMGVLRHMYSWGMEERKIKRSDNPAARITKNLPKKKEGEVVLSLAEARIVYRAAAATGYPFGTHTQLQLLTATRLDELASATVVHVDLDEALLIIPADDYKSNHVHVIPLVPQAIELLKSMPAPTAGPYLFSSTGGSTHIQGISKYYRSRLADAILSITGSQFTKRLTTQVNRRTVASRLAEELGHEGDKLVERVLGHSDGKVTRIYNRYGYVREMRRALEKWANDLTMAEEQNHTAPEPRSSETADYQDLRELADQVRRKTRGAGFVARSASEPRR